ncbi:MAG: hypothetical protein ACREWG_09825 [Gammaproteobacteria bacterium]
MSSEYSSTYGTARKVAGFVSFIGWILVGIGILGLGSLVQEAGGIKQLFSDIGAIAGILSLLVSVAGLLLVALGQVVRATVDNADNTGQMLAIIKATALEANQDVSKSE